MVVCGELAVVVRESMSAKSAKSTPNLRRQAFPHEQLREPLCTHRAHLNRALHGGYTNARVLCAHRSSLKILAHDAWTLSRTSRRIDSASADAATTT